MGRTCLRLCVFVINPKLQTCTLSGVRWRYFRLESSWNVMAHGETREGKWGGNWRMEWVASTLHTTSEHGVSSITTADTHTSAANSRLNWRPRRFKWTRPFCRKTKSSFCACAITFQTQSTTAASLRTCLLCRRACIRTFRKIVVPSSVSVAGLGGVGCQDHWMWRPCAPLKRRGPLTQYLSATS